MDDLVQTGRLSRKRYWSNKATQWVVGLGGAAVIGAITTIFAYLLWVVAPILLPASIDSHFFKERPGCSAGPRVPDEIHHLAGLEVAPLQATG